MPTRATEQNNRQRQGARLKVFREWLGLTQGELSQWIKANPKTTKSPIAAAEQGIRPIPTEALYETFGLSQDWVLGYTDDDWWGPEVKRIRSFLQAWIGTLSPEDNAEYGHPGARIAASYTELCKVSTLVTDQYAAAILKVGLEQWREVLSDDTFVNSEQWTRWAEWTGLPERWIAKGHLPPRKQDEQEQDPYQTVIAEARRIGISADKLLSMIRIMEK